VVGEYETAAYLNANVRDGMNFLLNPPIAVIYQNASQSVGNNTFTPLICDSTAWDTYGGHSNTVNNSRYYAQITGFYMIFAAVAFGPNSVGNRGITLDKNGTPLSAPGFTTLVPSTNASNDVDIGVSGMVQLTAGDYVEPQIYQSSGGALNLASGASGFAVMWVHA
jgi:hypothetical protein